MRSGRTVVLGALASGLLLVLLLASACAVEHPRLPAGVAGEVVRIAYKHLDLSRAKGTRSRESCASAALVKRVLVEAAVWAPSAPETIDGQSALGTPVRGSDLQPGDRLYLGLSRSGAPGGRTPREPDTTGLYLGAGQFIYATGKGVGTQKLTGVYGGRLLAARRDNALSNQDIFPPEEGTEYLHPALAYGLYDVREGDRLEEIAAQGNVSVAALSLANALDPKVPLTTGQTLRVPIPESAFKSTVRVYKAYALQNAVLRAGPSRLCNGILVKAGQTVYVFERPYAYDPGWRAIAVDSPERPWAWMRQQDLQFDRSRRLLYAVGRTAPTQPAPQKAADRSPLSPVIRPVPGLREAVASPAKRRALAIAVLFAQRRVPYQMGTQSLTRTDTSGLVWYCFTRGGVWPADTPRTNANEQSKRGRPVTGRLQPGDRLYYDGPRLGRGVMDHTMIYLGAGKMIEATPPHVKISPVTRLPIAKAMRDPD
jgi:cell wall-associated NlpC family hydrolase